MVSLRLEPRPWEEDKGNDNAAGAPRLKFRVLLSKLCPSGGLDLTWRWRVIEIEPVETSERPTAGSESGAQTMNVASRSIHSLYVEVSLIWQSTQANSRASPHRIAKKKAVNFSIPFSTQSTWLAAATEASHTGMGPIPDICTAVCRQFGFRQGIGFLIDEILGQHRHNVYLLDEELRQGVGPKSLEYLLQVSKQRGPGFTLSRRNRLYIAVTLASSVLQLGGTSWLKRQWTSGDILFLPLEDHKISTPNIDFKHPYVSSKVSLEDANTALVADASQNKIANRIPSEVLFVLGITLTELSFGQNIYAMRTEHDMDKTEMITNFNTASRLIEYVYEESGRRYGDVVRRCLKCPPDVRDPSIDNEDFQKAVFELIFTPLKEDFEDFEGGSRIY